MRNDVIEWMRPLIDSKTYQVRRSDGKFVMCPVTEAHTSPWHHINYSVGADCPYLHQQLFNVISARTPAGKFIPSRCQACWKIVIRPQNLNQLFALERLLIDLDLPSKCGIERRSYTPLSKYLYGGYIYNSSVEEGLERLDMIRSKLNESVELSNVEAYLKRACTEMEMAFPDSTSWQVTDEQIRVEKLLDWLIVYDIEASMTSKHILDKVHMTWIEWAAQHGDETYLEYTDGKPLYLPCVRYERKVDEDIDNEKARGADEATPDGETGEDGASSRAAPKGTSKRKQRSKKK